ncbi:MAG: electron transporter RnfD [Elusimicrobia bacterium CG08_land_8_20_14_0_20_59_10]|nr:MAG: electron transporter RnfD [Elusimicrobia bacterium CG08_land_8_20_14_0_20_59_10]
MENSKLLASYPPYVREEDSIEKIMYTVSAALLPAIGASVYYFGPRILALLLVCVFSSAGFEYLFNRVRKQEPTFLDGSAVLTGVLLALNLPSNLPLWMAALGAFVAIVIVKQLFGGLGFNIFNPALAARVFLLISFPVAMTSWPVPFAVDAQTAASPLGILKTEGLQALSSMSLWQAFSGGIGGSFGETSGLALLLGAAVLFWKRYITWIIPFSFIGMVFAFTGVFYLIDPSVYASPLFHMATGGLLLGAFFMATDMVTSPVSKRGQFVFGLGCGLLTAVIRLFGGYPEGVSFAILIMNAFVPLIDRWDSYSNSKNWKVG